MVYCWGVVSGLYRVIVNVISSFVFAGLGFTDSSVISTSLSWIGSLFSWFSVAGGVIVSVWFNCGILGSVVFVSSGSFTVSFWSGCSSGVVGVVGVISGD